MCLSPITIFGLLFQGRFYETPLENKDFKGDQCDPAGCFWELTLNLAIIMVGKQFLNNFMELGFP